MDVRIDPQKPPFSLRLDDVPFRDVLPEWCVEDLTQDFEAECRWRYSSPDGATCICLESRTLPDFRAAEWVLHFHNHGLDDGPRISDVNVVDWTLPVHKSAEVTVHHANGSRCRVDDFLPQETALHEDAVLAFSPIGGRSSDGALPFMSVDAVGRGIVLAIGWSGQWKAVLTKSADGVRIRAGMETFDAHLRPGETVRTPRILLLPWTGEGPEAGTNLLRRVLLEHYVPRDDNGPALPPTSHNRQLVYYLTGDAGEADHLRAIQRAEEIGLELFWTDALWYGNGGEWWEEVGTWDVRTDRFPNGLKPIADAAHAAGMRYMLWFEPERVRVDSKIAREHPEYLLSESADSENLLLDLGNDDARTYMTNLISSFITDTGIDIYRQDCNIEPLPYWQAADEPDRRGFTEARHIAGLYRMWDELRERHAGLLIDNCASGGRRIDLETTSRSFPLWRSDYTDAGAANEGYRMQIGGQCQTAGLSRWVPLHAASAWGLDAYSYRSCVSTGVCLYKDILAADFDVTVARACMEELERIRPLMLGDLYHLAPLTTAGHDWCAYQFHREDMDAGFVMFLRRHESPYETFHAPLRGICQAARYEYFEVGRMAHWHEEGRDLGRVGQVVFGSDLVRYRAKIMEKPGSLLLEYRPAK